MILAPVIELEIPSAPTSDGKTFFVIEERPPVGIGALTERICSDLAGMFDSCDPLLLAI